MLNGESDILNFTKRYIKKDGSLLWAELYASLFRSPEGEPLFYITTIIDITEKRKTEMDLADRDRLYNTFFNSCKDMIFLKDANFRYLLANDERVSHLNTDRINIIGKTDYELMDKGYADICRASDVKAKESMQPIMMIESIGNKVYETRKFHVPLGGDNSGIGAYIRDVTNEFTWQKKTERMADTYRIISEFLTKEYEDVHEQLVFALYEAMKQTDSKYGFFYSYKIKNAAFELESLVPQDDESTEQLARKISMKFESDGLFTEIMKNKKTVVFELGIENSGDIKKRSPNKEDA